MQLIEFPEQNVGTVFVGQPFGMNLTTYLASSDLSTLEGVLGCMGTKVKVRRHGRSAFYAKLAGDTSFRLQAISHGAVAVDKYKLGALVACIARRSPARRTPCN